MIELWDILDENGNKTGRLHKRGEPMNKGDFHLVVLVWIKNSNNEFLISKRAPNIMFPNIWQTTGGSAVSGDDSLTTALKETQEELGIKLDTVKGNFFKRYKNINAIYDIWLFEQDVNLNDVVLQIEETSDAMYASKEKIIQMVEDGTFIPFKYSLEEFFDFCNV